MKLIPVEERTKVHRCHFCGSNQSVKYVVEIKKNPFDNDPVEVYCCNKCVLLFDKEGENE